MLSNWLIDKELLTTPEALSIFQKELPLEWIEQALEQTNKVSIRRRKLPAELVVWLIVGIGLYRNRSISEWLAMSPKIFFYWRVQWPENGPPREPI
ncbi:hypothetical protein GCM10007938_25690 [Vibrio zhanjiangensis]|uniref:Transposase IS4 N-terminal domain-containing protein n=1 Tax=Vibrio zhanjiangensis TaxID=1046128 RepID=A0ABQ6EZX4_9VIBR|nr:hypothetical protein GCM10007938_25690 [Vibrio zhanjiangensis]